ncbi:MAG TPA: glycoside hydrolase family 3 C-terminal domain-containing protein [Solirubrobacteraceae bacterium]|nr:glycoside hydrolase family 3 C-terminal domain-containing protein [Solirubrobacteraceae bacterium]
MRLVLAALASVLALAAPAAAAGRCGDPGVRPWCDTAKSADERAGLLLAALTRDERISLLAGDELTGVLGQQGTHTGTSNGVERVGLPPVYFSDGPVGPRQGRATGMPSPMTIASTFDPLAAFRHAEVVGDEVRRKGNDVVFAPAVNMLRTPLNGRTFEYFGEDPYLAARMATAWTRGVQSTGVIANVKHFAVNNQEGQGGVPPIGAGGQGSRLTVDARLDERALREIYLPQFEAAVREGGAGSVMCAYPRVNGAYACENQHLLEEVLKRDWAFRGFVLTDYGAAKSTVNSLNNGLDLDVWPALAYRPELVNAALASSQVSESTVDEHVRRILRTLFAFGFFDRAAYVDDERSIDQAGHDAAAAELEQQGIVMLENDGAILPLDAGRIGRLAVIGPEADVVKDGGGSSAIEEFRVTTPEQGIRARVGSEKVVYDDGSDAARAAAVARAADVAVVVVGDRMTEGEDKRCMGLNCSQVDRVDRDGLIEAVVAAQPRTVVVLQTGGPVLTPWRDRVPALLEAWYPGQNGGTAIARVLFGDAEPGGRLPATFPLREEDEPTAGDPEKYPGVGETVRYKEGVHIGYRWFDERGLGVAYPFGYGLAYTTFRVDRLRMEAAGGDAAVSVAVTNTGSRAGTAAPQLYVGMPERGIDQPPLQLKGFARVRLAPGETRRMRFALDERAFSHWDTRSDGWRVTPGCYRIVAGQHSRDAAAEGVVGRGADCGAAALMLPRDRRACRSRRNFVIRLPLGVRRAKVTYAGRRAKIIRGRRLRARIDLRGLPRGRVRVKVVGRTASGRIVRETRVYRPCATRPTKSRRWPRRPPR